MGRLYTGCKKGAQSKMSTKLKFPQHLLQLNVSMGSLGSSATSYPCRVFYFHGTDVGSSGISITGYCYAL